MKNKIHLVLVVLALFTASMSVYATEYMFATVYYADIPNVADECNQEISLPCTESDAQMCRTASGLNVWKRIDSGPCTQVFKPVP